MVIHKSELADVINKLAGKEVVEQVLVGSPTKNQIQIVLKEEKVAAKTKEEPQKEAEKESAEPAKETSKGKNEESVKTKPKSKPAAKTKKAE